MKKRGSQKEKQKRDRTESLGCQGIKKKMTGRKDIEIENTSRIINWY